MAVVPYLTKAIKIKANYLFSQMSKPCPTMGLFRPRHTKDDKHLVCLSGPVYCDVMDNRTDGRALAFVYLICTEIDVFSRHSVTRDSSGKITSKSPVQFLDPVIG